MSGLQISHLSILFNILVKIYDSSLDARGCIGA